MALPDIDRTSRCRMLNRVYSRSIRGSMGLVFATFFVLGGLSVSLSLWTAHTQEQDAVLLNQVGRQRMLSAVLLRHLQLSRTDTLHGASARVTGDQLTTNLRSLTRGGKLLVDDSSITIAPIRDVVLRDRLEVIQAASRGLEARVDSALAARGGGADPEGRLRALEAEIGALVRELDAALGAYQRRAEVRILQLKWLQGGFLLSGLLALLLGSRLVTTQILRPVARLRREVRRVEQGDFAVTLDDLQVANELGELGGAFARMAARVHVHLREEMGLQRLSRDLLGAHDVGAVARAVMAAVRERYDAPVVGFYTRPQGRGDLVLTAVEGGEERRLGAARIPVGPAANELGWTDAEAAPVRLASAGRAAAHTDGAPECRVWIPAMASRGAQEEEPGLMGALALVCPGHTELGDSDVHYLGMAAQFAAAALQRIQQQEALRISEAKFSGILTLAADAIVSIDGAGAITIFNDGAEKIFDYSREEIIGKPLEVLLPESVRGIHQKHVRDFAGGPVSARRMGERREIRGRRKNGEEFPAEASISRLAVGEEMVYTAVVRDVTDRQRLEEQVRQSQRVAAMGTMAGGMSHFFNNLLMVIHGNSTLLLDDLPAGTPQREEAEQIHEAATRASALTRQLVAFSSRQVLSPVDLDPDDAILRMLPAVREVLGTEVRVETELGADRGRVTIDPDSLEKVLLELAANARDAMPDGGTLTLRTARVDVDRARAERHAELKPRAYLSIAVQDTGTGMDADVLTHLFEPFFTTKERAHTPGLGLSTAYGTIRQSDGVILVESEPGRGSTFTILLPRTEAEAPACSDPGEPARSPDAGEYVLLAEDEPSVRMVIGRVLERRGYRVLAAANGRDALRLAREHEEEIRMLITDIVMPGLGGRELADELRAGDPELPVLYISGYPEDKVFAQRRRGPGEIFLAKPFALQHLVDSVDRLLDRDAPGATPADAAGGR